MNEKDLETLARRWRRAKSIEKKMIDLRRTIEDTISANAEFGTRSEFNAGRYEVKVSVSETVKIDAEILQDVAADAGMDSELSRLFRWKPELEKAVWKKAPQEVKDAFLPAVKFQKQRPVFNVDCRLD